MQRFPDLECFERDRLIKPLPRFFHFPGNFFMYPAYI